MGEGKNPKNRGQGNGNFGLGILLWLVGYSKILYVYYIIYYLYLGVVVSKAGRYGPKRRVHPGQLSPPHRVFAFHSASGVWVPPGSRGCRGDSSDSSFQVSNRTVPFTERNRSTSDSSSLSSPRSVRCDFPRRPVFTLNGGPDSTVRYEPASSRPILLSRFLRSLVLSRPDRRLESIRWYTIWLVSSSELTRVIGKRPYLNQQYRPEYGFVG
jgi:hypothetical protein